MSGGKETPRQKMIGMMYLVLTALLALNISAEAIKAFSIVREGLDATSANFGTKVQFTYDAFDAAMRNDPVKTKPFLDKAKEASRLSTELFDYIEALKVELIEMGGGYTDNGELKGEKDLDKSSELMLTRGKGPELKDKINGTKEQLLALVEPEQRDALNLKLEAIDPPIGDDGLVSWEAYMFQGKPLTASVTLMSKLQTDVKNAELDMVNHLFKSISASDFKFDQLEATVIPVSDYVLTGQEYNAKVFISASSSTQDPEVYIGNVNADGQLVGQGNLLPVEEGKAIFKTVPQREGVIEYAGVIRVKKPGTEEFTDYAFKKSFIAAKSSVVVSADKMNVLYIGVENPMSISVPGIPNEKVTPRFKGDGRFTSKLGNGGYIAQVSSQGETTIEVYAELPNGDNKLMGSKVYRIKPVPPPTPKFAGVTEGAVAKSTLQVQRGVFADLENFDFDLRFTITRYRLVLTRKNRSPFIIEGNGPALPDAAIDQLKTQLESGERLVFDAMYAKGPDGKEVKLKSGILIEVK